MDLTLLIESAAVHGTSDLSAASASAVAIRANRRMLRLTCDPVSGWVHASAISVIRAAIFDSTELSMVIAVSQAGNSVP